MVEKSRRGLIVGKIRSGWCLEWARSHLQQRVDVPAGTTGCRCLARRRHTVRVTSGLCVSRRPAASWEVGKGESQAAALQGCTTAHILAIFNILLPNELSVSAKIKLNNNCAISTLCLFYAHLFPYLEAVSGNRNSPICFVNLLDEMVGSTFAMK